jgi:hypothetical protein
MPMTFFPRVERWHISEMAVADSLCAMAQDGYHGDEGIVFWLGRRHGGEATVTHLVALRGPGVVRRPDLVIIEPWLLNEVTDVTIELKVALVGQIHSHGDWHGVDLSITDRTRGIAVPYYLSVVAPSYAMDPRTRIEDCGVHVYEPGAGYRRLSAVEMSQRLGVMPGARVPLIIVGAEST